MASHHMMGLSFVGVALLLLPILMSAPPPCAAAGAEQQSGSTRPSLADDEEVAVIETTVGRIVLQFFPEVAPGHVKNFKKLAREAFYDSTTFHRVIPGFMIQGGDPNSKDRDRSNDGTGGPGYNIRAEFNDRPHKPGTLSMARSRDPHSAGSQFFICLGRNPHLDGQYTVFGQVVEGMDVVETIGSVERDARDNPKTPVRMIEVRIVEFGDLKKESEEED